MLVKSNKSHRHNNPKRQKRNRLVDVGKPLVPLKRVSQAKEREKLSDWEDAP